MKMTRSEAKRFVESDESWIPVETGRFTRCSLLTFEDLAFMKIERLYKSFAYFFNEEKMKSDSKQTVKFGAGLFYRFDPDDMTTSYSISKTQLIEAIFEKSREEPTDE